MPHEQDVVHVEEHVINEALVCHDARFTVHARLAQALLGVVVRTGGVVVREVLAQEGADVQAAWELVQKDVHEVEERAVLDVSGEHGAEHALVDAWVVLADVQLHEVPRLRLPYPLLYGLLCVYLAAPRYGGGLVVSYLRREKLP